MLIGLRTTILTTSMLASVVQSHFTTQLFAFPSIYFANKLLHCASVVYLYRPKACHDGIHVLESQRLIYVTQYNKNIHLFTIVADL